MVKQVELREHAQECTAQEYKRELFLCLAEQLSALYGVEHCRCCLRATCNGEGNYSSEEAP